jgi:molybdopterin converting factor small subunit
MIVKVALFASAREVFGGREIELELSPSATVADLKRELIEMYPEARDLVTRSAVSVDHEFSMDATNVNPDCEIALIPPVSGG